MKHASIIACVLAASVMPTAYAEQVGSTPATKAYEIKVQGQIAPSDLHELEYPYLAGVKSRSGACDLSVHVDTQGNIGAVSLESCTSASFADEAGKLVTQNAAIDVAESHPLRIEWSID